MTDNRLKSLADRIERLMNDRDGIQADIRDIYTEAKSAGYVPKVLRKAIMRKRMDASKRDEEDAILELYEGALGAVGKAVAAVRAGSTWKEASEEHDVPRATLARAIKAVSKQRNDTAAEITTARLDTPPGGSGDLIEGHSATPASDATGYSAHKGEENGSNSNGEGRSSEGLQPERQSGRGRDQGGNGGARHEDGGHPRPERRAGGPRGGSGDHQSSDGQHVVRSGGDQGSVIGGRGVGSVSTPPLGAVGAKPRVASDNDWPEMPAGLRRVRA